MVGYVKGSKEHVKAVFKRQLMIARVRKLMKEGLSTSEIAEKLNMSESTVRSYQNIIAEAETNGL